MVGSIFLSLAVARFCRVLGTLLKNGVPILKSLDISSDSTGNRVLAVAIKDATEGVSAGKRLAGPLGACGHFPPTVVEMISVAEESNSLGDGSDPDSPIRWNAAPGGNLIWRCGSWSL